MSVEKRKKKILLRGICQKNSHVLPKNTEGFYASSTLKFVESDNKDFYEKTCMFEINIFIAEVKQNLSCKNEFKMLIIECREHRTEIIIPVFVFLL